MDRMGPAMLFVQDVYFYLYLKISTILWLVAIKNSPEVFAHERYNNLTDKNVYPKKFGVTLRKAECFKCKGFASLSYPGSRQPFIAQSNAGLLINILCPLQ